MTKNANNTASNGDAKTATDAVSTNAEMTLSGLLAGVPKKDHTWGSNIRGDIDWDSLPRLSSTRCEFIPMLPNRLRFSSDLGDILSGTAKRFAKKEANTRDLMEQEGVDRETAKRLLRKEGHRKYACKSDSWLALQDELTVADMLADSVDDDWLLLLPEAEAYQRHRAKLTEMFRRKFGYIRPFDTDITVKIEVLYDPKDKWSKRDLDNCLKTIFDAMDYREKAFTRDENGKRVPHKLGLIADDEFITHVIADKRPIRPGEKCGFWIRISSVRSMQDAVNRTLAYANTVPGLREQARAEATEHSDAWEAKLADGLTARELTDLRIACMATAATTLDPIVARHYVVLKAEYNNREIAEKIALDEQSSIWFERLVGHDVEPTLCEIEEQVEELAERNGITFDGFDDLVDRMCIQAIDQAEVNHRH